MSRRIIIIEDEGQTGIGVDQYQGLFDKHEYDPCANCNNNPKNNHMASGFCNCVLPYMHHSNKEAYKTVTELPINGYFNKNVTNNFIIF